MCSSRFLLQYRMCQQAWWHGHVLFYAFTIIFLIMRILWRHGCQYFWASFCFCTHQKWKVPAMRQKCSPFFHSTKDISRKASYILTVGIPCRLPWSSRYNGTLLQQAAGLVGLDVLGSLGEEEVRLRPEAAQRHDSPVTGVRHWPQQQEQQECADFRRGS